MRKPFRGVKDLDPVRADRVIKVGENAKTIWPRWEAQPAEMQNVFRLLPVIDPETGKMAPYRLSGERRDFGPWLYAAHIAQIGGPRGLTFVIGDRRDYPDALALREAPYCVLYDKVSRAIQTGAKPEWRQYNLVRLRSDDGSPPPLLMAPELRYMAMALVVSHYDYPFRGTLYGLSDNEPLFIVVMTRMAGIRLMDKLDSEANLSIDPISLSTGVFVKIHPSVDPGYRGYDVSFLPSVGSLTPALDPKKVGPKLRWWDDVIHIPTVQEQVSLLCESSIPPEVLVYGLCPEFASLIPDHIYAAADAAKGRPATSAPATTPVIQDATAAPADVPWDWDAQVTFTPGAVDEEVLKAMRAAEERKRNRNG